MNTFKIVMLMTILLVLFMALGGLVGGRPGMIIATVIAVAMNFGAYWFSDKMVLKMYRAREITEREHPRYYRAVSRVATKASAPMPRVCVVPSKAPNAFATGRDQEHAVIAVTEGMLEILEDQELEGVIGHEMAHILNRDMLIGAIAATFAGAIGILASIARWGAIFGGVGRSDDDDGGGLFGLLAAAIVAPLAAMVVQMAISRQREFKADALGGRITGQYLPLASALTKLHHAPVRMNLDRRPGTANLMIVNPLSGRGLSSMFSTHPPIEKRIERLKELAQNSTYEVYAGN